MIAIERVWPFQGHVIMGRCFHGVRLPISIRAISFQVAQYGVEVVLPVIRLGKPYDIDVLLRRRPDEGTKTSHW
jgi:hypothetical protein